MPQRSSNILDPHPGSLITCVMGFLFLGPYILPLSLRTQEPTIWVTGLLEFRQIHVRPACCHIGLGEKVAQNTVRTGRTSLETRVPQPGACQSQESDHVTDSLFYD